MSTRSACLVAVCVGLGAVQSLDAQATRLGGEFQVNVTIPYYQDQPDAAMDGNGNFVVVWQSYPSDGNLYGVVRRRFNSTGAPLTGETVVNTHITAVQNRPAIAMDRAGAFVVAWVSNLQDGDSFGIFTRRFDSSGSPLATEMQVNQNTGGAQTAPAVALNENGDFVVAWNSFTSTQVRARLFNPAGPQGSEFRVDNFTASMFSTFAARNPTAAITDDGDFVVAYEDTSTSTAASPTHRIMAQRFDIFRNPIGNEIFLSGSSSTAARLFPAAAMDADGDFVVVWQSAGQDGSGSGVFGRRVDSAGVVQGAEFQVNTFTTDFQNEPDVAMDASGRFMVVWQSNIQDGSFTGVFGRTFALGGTPQATEFRIPTYTVSGQNTATIGMNDKGAFVVSWQSYYQDGSYSGVFAQRFALPLAFDLDADGTVQTLTDGLLWLRYLFGFTGATLSAGAVDPDCARCADPALTLYIVSIQSAFDIDGDGELAALTDGLLVVRHLFGFTGATLITGAFDVDCTRCDAPAIEAYLDAVI